MDIIRSSVRWVNCFSDEDSLLSLFFERDRHLIFNFYFRKKSKKDDGQNDEVAEKSSDIFSAVGGRMLKCCIDFPKKKDNLKLFKDFQCRDF